MNLWLIVGMLIIIPKHLKGTVTLSTEKQWHTIIYYFYTQSCKQISSSRAVKIVWNLMGGKAWKQELHLCWGIESDYKKHWSNSFPEIRQWFQCTESVYCFKRWLISQYCIKQLENWTICVFTAEFSSDSS